MDTLYLVRHAKAGERRTWTGPDDERPLSKKGWRQSRALAAKLVTKAPTGLYSSYYTRCVQTLEPLGELSNLPVTVLDVLAEYEPAGPVVEFMRDAPDRTVMCSHGDIIPATIKLLIKSGMDLDSSPDWRKAATWVLKRNRHGKIVRGHAWPPRQ